MEEKIEKIDLLGGIIRWSFTIGCGTKMGRGFGRKKR